MRFRKEMGNTTSNIWEMCRFEKKSRRKIRVILWKNVQQSVSSYHFTTEKKRLAGVSTAWLGRH